MNVFVFKLGALAVAVCSVLLLFAVAGALFVEREFTDSEKLFAYVAAALIGTCWWLFMLRRLRRRGELA